MVYIYLPAVYYHLNLDVTKENLLAAGFFRCPSGLSCLPWNAIVKRCVNTIVQEQCGNMSALFVQEFILHFQTLTRAVWKSIGVQADICNFDILHVHRNHKENISVSMDGKLGLSRLVALMAPGTHGTGLDTTYGRHLLAYVQGLSGKDLCTILNSFLTYSTCVLSSQDLSEIVRFNILQFAHQMPIFPYDGAHCSRLEEFTACWNLLQQICGPKVKGFEQHATLGVEGCKIQSEMDASGCKWQDILLEYYIEAGYKTLWPLVVQAWDNPMFLDSGVYSFTHIIKELDKTISLLEPGVQEISRKCGSMAGKRIKSLLQKERYLQIDALAYNYIWENLLHELNGHTINY